MKIMQCLQAICDDESESHLTRHEASCLAEKMEELETSLMTVIWDTILRRFDATTHSLQNVTVSLGESVRLYESLCDFLGGIREQFGRFEEEAKTLVDADYSNNRIQLRKKAFDETSENEVSLSQSDKFRTTTFYVIIDRLLSELTKRMNNYTTLRDRFDFLHNWRQLNDEELYSAASNLNKVYPEDVENFGDELIQMKYFLKSDDSVLDPVSLFTRLLNLQV
jgi:hypothetical protein